MIIIEPGYYIVSKTAWDKGYTKVEDFKTGTITKTTEDTIIQNPCKTRFNRKSWKLEITIPNTSLINSLAAYVRSDGSIDMYTDILFA